MRSRNSRYIDFKLIEHYPNKYDLTPSMIRKLRILDWDRLKKETWYNEAMKKTGSWWCHLEDCSELNSNKKVYCDEDEFWIGFREENNTIDYNFTSYGGMCGYSFDKFYSVNDIENKYDMVVQVKAIRFLNRLLDAGILGLPEVE